MADRRVVDPLLASIFESEPATPERSRAIGRLVAVLRGGGDIARWCWRYSRDAGGRSDTAEELGAICEAAIFRWLFELPSLEASNPVGVVHQVGVRAVHRHVSRGADTGLSGVTGLLRRTAAYQRARAQVERVIGDGEPLKEEIFGAAHVESGSAEEREGSRLVDDETGLYRAGGALFSDWEGAAAEAGIARQSMRRDDHDDRLEAAVEATFALSSIVDTIITDYREMTGLLWFALVTAEFRQQFPGEPDDLARIARRAALTDAVAQRYHDIIVANPRLDAAVSAGAEGDILIVAEETVPGELGFVTYARYLMRAVLAAEPGEVGLLTYAHAWISISALDGQAPGVDRIAQDVRTNTGVSMSQRQARKYAKALGKVLEGVRAAARPEPLQR
ncbi:hypothetical protein [Curtobacterium sp. 20TX0008]|uniref:hypothetical protein n=1 Tax=Curtobacterium sp. 20TX0008 TaxID=3022018 RepID=UPI00232E35EC|nr:hypothetical protein [Curtobacterium sp. 20TX0008]MDB6425880.1 hypothetical protein [Curtobacterium sp. 20TX0008]